MPTYEYSCDGCGTTLERWQRFTDTPLIICPSCGGRLERVFNSVGIIFKGSGWYCTDSRSKGKSDSESSSSKPATAAASA